MPDVERLSPDALGSLYMAVGSIGYVVNDAAIRRITDEGPGVYQALCMRSIALVAVFAAIGRVRGEPTQRFHFGRPMMTRVAAEVGAETVRVGDLSVSSPFRYTVIVGAVVAGYVLFDEVPDRFTVIGSVVIIVSGLWSIRLDRSASSPG